MASPGAWIASASTAIITIMKRPFAMFVGALLGALFLGVVAVVAVRRNDARPAMRPAPADNPGGFVASDVALLAATGRPQLVEIFHYG